MAAITFSRVPADTDAPDVKVRDTAETETPANFATSFAVARRSMTLFLLFDFELVIPDLFELSLAARHHTTESNRLPNATFHFQRQGPSGFHEAVQDFYHVLQALALRDPDSIFQDNVTCLAKPSIRSVETVLV